MKGYIIAFIVASLSITTTLRADLASDVETAFAGREVNNSRVGKNGFHIKPITVTKSKDGKRIIAQGQLSHRRPWAKDDQIHYSIVINEPGAVATINYKINKGGYEQIFGDAGRIVDDVTEKTVATARKGWKGSMDQVFAMIAFKLEDRR